MCYLIPLTGSQYSSSLPSNRMSALYTTQSSIIVPSVSLLMASWIKGFFGILVTFCTLGGPYKGPPTTIWMHLDTVYFNWSLGKVFCCPVWHLEISNFVIYPTFPHNHHLGYPPCGPLWPQRCDRHTCWLQLIQMLPECFFIMQCYHPPFMLYWSVTPLCLYVYRLHLCSTYPLKQPPTSPHNL